MFLGGAVTVTSTAASVFVNDLNSDGRKGTLCQQLGTLRVIVSQMYNASQVNADVRCCVSALEAGPRSSVRSCPGCCRLCSWAT